MPQQTINLNDNQWLFGQVARRPFDEADVYDLPAVAEWLPATVPGNVRTDLLALNRIPDPFWAEDYQKSLWVEDVDWWYRRIIEVDNLAPDQRAFLIFKGIDYLSTIFINGQEMARHEGMFSRQTIEITDALRSGSVEIAVRVWGSGALPKRLLNWRQKIWQKIAAPLYDGWDDIYPDRSTTLKCQMSFGWDFAPPIRTMGIWDDVPLLVTGPVGIVQASAIGQPLDPHQLPPDATHAPANITLNLDIDSNQPRSVGVDVQLTPANFSGETLGPLHASLDLPAGQSDHRLEFELSAAALWQPWDRGEPCLYQAQIQLNTPEGQRLDDVVVRTGVRSIEVEEWQFIVNGRPEFIRGLNWVPADSFPGRLRAKKYQQLLTQARQSGANLLRVWGGGLREKRAFYDLCDELGLLVWQEFPFACMFLGSFPRDADYLRKAEAECSAIVRQIRHHPSVALWCGGNEFSPRRNRPLLDTLAGVVRQHDPARPFIPVSPGSGQGDDHHSWDVWHGDAPIRAYQRESARFLSEFGLQALPHADTLKAMLPEPTTSWEAHHADPAKLRRYILPFILAAERKDAQAGYRLRFFDFSTASSEVDAVKFLAANINASQRAQAAASQTAIEQMRRRKGEAGGVCLWQFNEPWPAISWAIVDYFGRPKMACRQLANWYHPVLISLKFPAGHPWRVGDTFRAEIWGINDSNQDFQRCRLEIELDNSLIYQQFVDLPINGAAQIEILKHRLTALPEHLALKLYHQDTLLVQNSYDLSWHDEAGGSLGKWLRRRLVDWVLH